MDCPGRPHKDCPFVDPIRIVSVDGENFTDLTERQEEALRSMGVVS